MNNNINLKSDEWCDLIFKNRNKAYGAYKMRKSSSQDHLIALGITIIFTTIISLLSLIYNTPISNPSGNKRTEDHEIIKIQILPAPPKMQSFNIMFPQPEITLDNKIIKETGDDKNGILYEEGEYRGVSIIIHIEDECTKEIDVIMLTPIIKVIQDNYNNTHGDPLGNDINPCFPGGEDELYRFLKKNLRYPSLALEIGIQGRVVIGFTVSKTGEIINPKIHRSLFSACDKEAIRLIKLMPKWLPGRSGGQTVNVNYILPIQFTLI